MQVLVLCVVTLAAFDEKNCDNGKYHWYYESESILEVPNDVVPELSREQKKTLC
jgi:hypothetical protein